MLCRPSVSVLLNDIADLMKVYKDDLDMFHKGKLNIVAEFLHDENESFYRQESSGTPSLIQVSLAERGYRIIRLCFNL